MEVIQQLKKIYDLKGELRLLEDVKEGYISVNSILIDDGKKYFLKQYGFDDIERIDNIHKVEDIFFKKDIPIVMPYECKDGSKVFTFKEKYYTLYPFVYGRMLRRENLSNQAISSLGNILGRIHLVSKDGYPSTVFRSKKYWDMEEFVKEAERILLQIQNMKEKSDIDMKFAIYLEKKINMAKENDLRFENFNIKNDHLIHGDYHEKNVFFDNDVDEIKYVFDLDNTTIAPRSYELVRALDLTCLNLGYDDECRSNAKVFLDSYRNVYDISKEELMDGFKVYFLKKVHSLWIATEHYVNNSTRVDCFLDNEISMLDFYSKGLEGLVEKLIH